MLTFLACQVKNPPKDAYNPDDWRDFFSQFAEKQVMCVTVALNNDLLLWKLTLRRMYLNQLRLQLPKNTDLENEDVVRNAVFQVEKEREAEPKGCLIRLVECLVCPFLRPFGLFLPPHVLVDRIFNLTEEIKKLQKEHYDVTDVFVTFETESGQVRRGNYVFNLKCCVLTSSIPGRCREMHLPH